MGPIFNEKFDKKLNLWVRKQCTDALFTEDRSKVAAVGPSCVFIYGNAIEL